MTAAPPAGIPAENQPRQDSEVPPEVSTQVAPANKLKPRQHGQERKEAKVKICQEMSHRKEEGPSTHKKEASTSHANIERVTRKVGFIIYVVFTLSV